VILWYVGKNKQLFTVTFSDGDAKAATRAKAIARRHTFQTLYVSTRRSISWEKRRERTTERERERERETETETETKTHTAKHVEMKCSWTDTSSYTFFVTKVGDVRKP